ncbi:MAG: phosphoribosylaminoimidazolesuccinocarboxamide synthase, partial [Bacteroidales bacterium]|nr:phosphoribosylaminoimidazolesuccinocarboxamide synthase [Bacteroidales bacterium]
LIENGLQGREGERIPDMTPDRVQQISERYIELYEHITGKRFEKSDTNRLMERVEANVTACLKSL